MNETQKKYQKIKRINDIKKNIKKLKGSMILKKIS